MSQGNVEVVLKMFDGWNRGDIEAWLHASHPKVEYYSAVAALVDGRDRVWRGRAELRQFWDEWHSVWDLAVEVAQTRDFGDTVIAIGRFRTRGRASRLELDSPVAYVVEFESGLVRRVRAYLDPSKALEAVSLSEHDAHADS
jgi:ketosteroid isomerase-like protein